MTTLIAAYFSAADRAPRNGNNAQDAVAEAREPMGDAVTILWTTVGAICVTIVAAFLAA